MMAVSLLLFLSSSLCLCLLVFVPDVTGVTAKSETYDLHVDTVSRVWLDEGDIDEHKVQVTVNFTASIQPQVRWTYASNAESVEVTDTELTFSGGRGEARATMDFKVKMVTLKIGYFDSHSLAIFIKRDFPIDTSQTLNTRLSSVSPGYDITYDPGESFQVTAFIPKHIADDFTWSRFMNDPEGEYNVRLDAVYVDQSSGGVLDTVDNIHHPDMSKFLQSSKSLGEDGARWQLNFSTAAQDLSGYFRFFTLNSHNNFTWFAESDTWNFVILIWEEIDVKIHNASTPGPFPDKFAAVETTTSSKHCDEGEKCSLYCYGFANNISRVSIFKEDTGESAGPLFTHVQNSHHVSFHNHFVTSGDFTGNYVCQVEAADGTTARKIIEVI